MLVLSRKKNEAIVLNDNIVITVVEIRDDKVRLRIDAPLEVSVHRREVYEAIRRPHEVVVTEPTSLAPLPLPVTTPAPPPPPPLWITVAERHVALIDRFRDSIRAATGSDPGPQRTSELMLDAVEEAQDHLELLVIEALRVRSS